MHGLALRTAPLLVVAGLAVGLGARTAPTPTRDLFLAVAPGASAAPVAPPAGATALRQRLARVDRDLLGRARADAGRPATGSTPLRLNLFDNVALVAEVDRTGPTSTGYWLSGSLAGPDPGSLTLVVNGDLIVGTVHAPDGVYTVRAASDGQVMIRQIGPSTFPRCAGTLGPTHAPHAPDRLHPIDRPSPAHAAPALPGGLEDGSRIDVLVVYEKGKPRARAEAQIDLLVAETNHALADSGVVPRIHLAAARSTDYSARDLYEEEDWARGVRNALHHLADPTDGRLDEVAVLRDQVAADIVVLVLFGIWGGVAWDTLPGADGAFAVVAGVDSGNQGLTFAHELGHIMGSQHDRYEHRFCSRWCPPGRQEDDLRTYRPFPYSFGYVNQRGFNWRTIMAYRTQCLDVTGEFCPIIPRFSNPDRTWAGDPLGVPGDKPSNGIRGPADARRTFNETRRFVANHRVSPCLAGGTRVQLQAGSGHYVVAVNNGGGNVLATGSRQTRGARFKVVDADGGCVEPGDVISLRTGEGFYLRAVGGGGSTVDATAPSATPWAEFTVRRARGKGAVRSGDLVTLQARTGEYVCAADGGGGAVRADCARPGAWGRFKVTGVQ